MTAGRYHNDARNNRLAEWSSGDRQNATAKAKNQTLSKAMTMETPRAAGVPQAGMMLTTIKAVAPQMACRPADLPVGSTTVDIFMPALA